MDVNRDFFKYVGLRKYLSHLLEQGDVMRLCDWRGDAGIILRHDVDFDQEAAHRLYILEKEAGVRSTFFALLTSSFYNPMSAQGRRILQSMCADGFEVGLHFDPSVYGSISRDEMEKKVVQQASVLSEITGVRVESVSLHNPSVNGEYPLFQGFRNAYDPRIFTDSNYLADSCMDFRGKDPYDFVKRAKNAPVQVVLHPMHFSENGDDYLGIFSDYLDRMIMEIDHQFRINSSYCSLVKGGELRAELETRDNRSRKRTHD